MVRFQLVDELVLNDETVVVLIGSALFGFFFSLDYLALSQQSYPFVEGRCYCLRQIRLYNESCS